MRRWARSSATRRLVPALPRPAWILVGGACGCYVAVGFVSAFLVIYLHYVRGVRLGTAGVALGAVAFAGLALSPLVGSMSDRVGAKTSLIGLLAVGAVGSASFAFVSSPAHAILAGALYGAGIAGITGPEAALLATLVDSRLRSTAFAMHYAAMSLGLSLGALGGGMFVDIRRPVTFQMGFVVTTIPLAVYALALTRVAVPANEPKENDDAGTDETAGGDGYRRVVSDGVFLRVLAFYLFVIVFAGGQFEVAYPAYAVGVAGVGTRVVGYSFAFGALTVIAGMIFMLRILQGRRRTRVIYVAAAFASGCWLLVLASAHVGGGFAAAAGMCLAMILFGVAETMWAPTYLPLVNELAPDNLRGRYNALSATVDGAGRVIAPLLAGYLLQLGWGDALMLLLAGGIAAAVLFLAGIERRLSSEANTIGGSSEVVSEAMMGQDSSYPPVAG